MNTITKTVITNADGSKSLQITVQAPTPAPIQPPTPAPESFVFSPDALNTELANAQADLAATQEQQPNDLAAFVAQQASVIATKEANIADIQDSIDKLNAAIETPTEVTP